MCVPYVIFLCFGLTVCRIAGLQWIFLEAMASGRPSVINISAGHVGRSQAVNHAIRSVSFFQDNGAIMVNSVIGYECRNPCCG